MRDWSRISPSSFLGIILRAPLRLLPKQWPMPILSGPNKGFQWLIGSSIYTCWFGSYEQQKQDALMRCIKPGMVIYDVGANAGFYTLLFSKLVGSTGRVISIEALPSNAANVLRHVRLNGLTNVTVIPAAISKQSSLERFQTAESNAMGFLGQGSETLLIPTLTLDSLVSMGLPPPDLVKMDIEGGEGDALEGSKNLLERAKTTWFIALHGESATTRSLAALARYGYHLFSLLGQPLGYDSLKTDEFYASPTSIPGKGVV